MTTAVFVSAKWCGACPGVKAAVESAARAGQAARPDAFFDLSDDSQAEQASKYNPRPYLPQLIVVQPEGVTHYGPAQGDILAALRAIKRG